MKVLYWSPLFHPYVGGIEVLGAHFLPALVERGHEVVVLTSHGALELPDDDEWNGITVHRRPFTDALASGDAGRIVELLAEVKGLRRAFRPDVVHLHVSDALGFFDLRTRAAHPAATVVAVQVTVGDGGGPTSLLSDLLRSADVVTAGSAHSLQAAIAACPEAADRSRLILNGLPPIGRPLTDPPPGPPVLVAAGRLVVDKGFDVALRALVEVRQRHPDVVLRLIGDGPDRPALEALATELGIADAVELAGWVAPERLPEALESAHVVVMPSRWQEAFGLVALHGMQVGRPVVASSVGGLGEVVDDGTTGLLVPPEDPPALAAAVTALLDDPARARRMGEAGFEQAETRFGFEPYVEAHVALYEELVGR